MAGVASYQVTELLFQIWCTYVYHCLHSGKRQHNTRKPPYFILMRKLTIVFAIFISYVKLAEGSLYRHDVCIVLYVSPELVCADILFSANDSDTVAIINLETCSNQV